ncbi:MAG: bifunctional ADP-dependent NAD(P)H-hydrate dehydratase/NAD(P)H-hydrate epimerase [Deltaproteobacteria bacterium HGW-Deltaproteobacteria-11]|nr:MAG: bifunctional ADP-dependent NAD(P)H-hydrate dehydratase/NAD(P)H-hydrate epimerase [Deltaproteobacteria bacterium HGW-Deltaproteobacteria-11]
MKVSSVDEMRAMDRYAVEQLGIPEAILMENAGQAAASVLSREIGIRDRKIVIFCGAGNNGGDGFVVARKIHADGGSAKVYLMGDPEKFRGAARMNLEILAKLPVEVRPVESMKKTRMDVLHSHGIVDAIFGTGLDREISGLAGEVIALINASGKKVLSLDIPSGVNGDTGRIMGVAVQADYTVTFGLPKIGAMLYPGYERCGKLYVCHISFPPSLYDRADIKIQVNRPAALPPRDISGHKGSMGTALFIAGAAGYFGAPYFSAMSFLKAGGGYARLAAPRSMAPFIAGKGSEIVFIPQIETGSGSIALENKKSLIDLCEKMDMVVIGPGLSLDPETQRLVRELVKTIKAPVLIDGDGITAVSADLKIISKRKAPTVLTPHLGEMARMTGKSATEIDRQKIAVLQKTAGDLGALVVLKGAHSLIACPDERVFINLSGNSGMATAGSGDVLTGAIAAMLGLGLPLEEAVKKGVFIHGFAGDLAAAEKGEDGMTARDILDYLPQAMKQDREGPAEPFRSRYAGPIVV